ncbi:MAG: mechanosensitive ion channel [bacterium]|nr:mechanosensitive ion channel [bacterium]
MGKDLLTLLQKTIFTIDTIEVSFLVLLEVLIPTVLGLFAGKFTVRLLRSKVSHIWEFFGRSKYIVEIVLRLFLVIGGISIGFKIAGIDRSVFYYFYTFIFKPFFHIGSSPISVMSISLLLIIISASIFISKYAANLLDKDVYPETSLELGVQNVINTFLKYFIVTIGLIIGLQVNGINLSVFATIGAALMVGIGFGLQNLASNFISGIVILLERPIKVGDYVEVEGIYGIIEHINARSTLIKTRENILMIVPNSKFISENVINWSHNDDNVLLKIPIGIAYESDPEQAKRVLLDIAKQSSYVMDTPSPNVLLNQFGNSSVDMVLEVWTSNMRLRHEVISDINFAVSRRFSEEGIRIPFPQLDIHMRGQDEG